VAVPIALKAVEDHGGLTVQPSAAGGCHLEKFIVAIDHAWVAGSAPKILLRVIVSTALMLQVDYIRGTKDSDVLEAADIPPEIKAQLLSLAGSCWSSSW
jgi:hypothetical protein